MVPLDGDKWLGQESIESKGGKRLTPKITDKACITFKLIGKKFTNESRKGEKFIKMSRHIGIITILSTSIITINVIGQNWSLKRQR